MFEIIKFYYQELRVYSLKDVETFRDAGYITAEQFNEITGDVNA